MKTETFGWRVIMTQQDVVHLADELDVLPLDLLHHHDLHFVEEVQRQVAQSVSVSAQEVVSVCCPRLTD